LKNAKDRLVELNTELLDQEKLSVLEGYIEGLEDKAGSLIHVLHKAQGLFGYLPENLQLHVARKMDLPAAKVNGVVSFYSFFTQEPRGKHTISLCMGTACFVKGADNEDGLFTLKDIRCVGACGLAPVMLVDDKVYGHVKAEDIQRILQKYRDEEDSNGH